MHVLESFARRLGWLSWLGAWLLVALTPSLAAAAGGEGGHGHVSITDLLGLVEFWGAVVNFVLLIFLLRKLAKRPLQSYLDGRREAVERGMQEAAELKAKAEAVFNEYTERLKTMDADIEKLREDGKRAAEAERQRIIAEAEAQSERTRAETQALIARHRETLAQEVRRDLVEAAVTAAEQVLREQTTREDQGRLASTYKDALGDVTGPGPEAPDADAGGPLPARAGGQR